MNLPILKGIFSQADALDILTQMVQIKIKYHENKIDKSQNEEDIKSREQRIKQLHKDFYEAKQLILSQGASCELDGDIIIKAN